MKLSIALVASTLICLSACATRETPKVGSPQTDFEIETKEIVYSDGKTQMVGYLAMPKTEGKRPGVLVVHEWWGQTEYPRKRAESLAREGYVALAVDMYGDRKIATHPKQAQSFAEKTMKNFKVTESRFEKALETLKNQDEVDPEKIAAIGYCYGGGIVLEMARRGSPLDMAFSFHGSLQGQSKASSNKTKAQIYVFNGAADPMVPESQVSAFKNEMSQAKVDYEFQNYPGALHAFSNPDATELGKKFNLPIAYDAAADKDSWERTLKALKNL